MLQSEGQHSPDSLVLSLWHWKLTFCFFSVWLISWSKWSQNHWAFVQQIFSLFSVLSLIVNVSIHMNWLQGPSIYTSSKWIVWSGLTHFSVKTSKAKYVIQLSKRQEHHEHHITVDNIIEQLWHWLSQECRTLVCPQSLSLIS